MAASVIDISEPQTYDTPTAGEMAQLTTLFSNIPAFPPGSGISALRGTPTALINTGLDAPVPAAVDNAQHDEVGTFAQPELSHTCPAITVVTISVSEYTSLKTAETFIGLANQAAGILIIDSRDLTLGAPVTAALSSNTSGGGGQAVGVPVTIPSRTHNTTFGDLPFFTAIGGFDVSETTFDGAMLVVSQVSYDMPPPSISYTYDDSGCSLLASNPTAVTTVGPLQLLVLSLTLLLVGAGWLQRRVA